MIFDKFNPNLRVEVDPATLEWVALPSLMTASKELYDDIVRAREARAGKGKPYSWPKIKANARLRTAQPW